MGQVTFGWWALLAIPFLLLSFRIMGGRSHYTSSLLAPLALFAVGTITGVFLWESEEWLALFAMCVPVSGLIQRISGRFATSAVMKLMYENEGALATLLARGDAVLVSEIALLDDPYEQQKHS